MSTSRNPFIDIAFAKRVKSFSGYLDVYLRRTHLICLNPFLRSRIAAHFATKRPFAINDSADAKLKSMLKRIASVLS